MALGRSDNGIALSGHLLDQLELLLLWLVGVLDNHLFEAPELLHKAHVLLLELDDFIHCCPLLSGLVNGWDFLKEAFEVLLLRLLKLLRVVP